MSHGTDHSPWIAMNEPALVAPSGAIHQKRALRNTRVTPAHCSPRLLGCGCAGVSGTISTIASAAAKVAAESTTKIVRHETIDKAAARGAVERSAPIPAATIIQPESDACRSAGYHVAIALSGAI